jgi:hypothetical protein
MGEELPTFGFPTLAEYAAAARELEGLTAKQAQDAETALGSTLTELLGNDFPNQTRARRHPLMRLLVNNAPWTRLELISLAGDVETTRHETGFARLRDGIRDDARYSEAASLIHLGAALVRAGYRVGAEAALDVGDRIKRPDLTIWRDAGVAAFVIELKQLRATDEQRRADEASWRIIEALFAAQAGTTWCGIVRRIPSPPRLLEVSRSIALAIERLPQTGFQTVEIDSVISLALADSSEDARFKAFAKAHGCEAGTILGPDVRGSESQRVLSVLKAKRHQCSRDVPSLVAIQCSSIVMHSRALADLAADVRETLGAHDAIAGSILFSHHLGKVEARSLDVGDARYACRTRSDVVCQHLLFVRNPFARCPLPAEDWMRVQVALEQDGSGG